MTDYDINRINHLIDNAFKAYENCEEINEWGKNYWQEVIRYLLRKYNRMC